MLAALSLSLLGGLTIDLPASIEVRGTELRLGDIAEVSGDDEQAVHKARLLVLGQTPSPGYKRQLVRADIVRELGLVLSGTELSFSGSPLVRISTKTLPIAADEQVRAAREALLATFEGSDVDLTLSTQVKDLLIPVPRGEFELKPRGGTLRKAPGPQGVAVDVVLDGQVYRTLWTSWIVDQYEVWPVLRTAVHEGETLNQAHFEPRRVRVRPGRISRPLATNAYGVAQAARTLEAGYVVLEEDVVRAWTVLAGDLVQLEVKSGSVQAQVRAQVLRNGRKGDRVGVRLESNARELVAVVVSKGLLRIDLTPAPEPAPAPAPVQR